MKRITILAVLLASAVSCNLDRPPYGGLTIEQQLSEINGFERAIKGVYENIAKGIYNEGTWVIAGDVFSDNLAFNWQGRLTQRSLYEFTFTDENNAFPIYNSSYRTIALANIILDNLNNVRVSDKRNVIEAEALALRAISHFDIVRVYRKIPTQSPDAKESIGIFYSETFNPNLQPSHKGTTVKEVYDKVIRDLEKAVTLIGNFKEEGRLSKQAIHGLLSRVYLHYGEYQKASENATLAKQGNSVIPRTKVADFWKDGYKDGALLRIRIVDKDNVSMGVAYGQQPRAEFVPAYDFYQLYKNNDIRKTATIEPAVFGGNNYNLVSKYFGRASGAINVVDGKYLRIEEVILNNAEALYRQGKETEALAELNLVRAERYENFESANETGETLLQAILLERRLELAFEGDRFFTLKRLALGIQRGNYGEFADGTGTPPKVQTLSPTDTKWQIPIPRVAINVNPNVKE